jgi:hypothetical protein
LAEFCEQTDFTLNKNNVLELSESRSSRHWLGKMRRLLFQAFLWAWDEIASTENISSAFNTVGMVRLNLQNLLADPATRQSKSDDGRISQGRFLAGPSLFLWRKKIGNGNSGRGDFPRVMAHKWEGFHPEFMWNDQCSATMHYFQSIEIPCRRPSEEVSRNASGDMEFIYPWPIPGMRGNESLAAWIADTRTSTHSVHRTAVQH